MISPDFRTAVPIIISESEQLADAYRQIAELKFKLRCVEGQFMHLLHGRLGAAAPSDVRLATDIGSESGIHVAIGGLGFSLPGQFSSETALKIELECRKRRDEKL